MSWVVVAGSLPDPGPRVDRLTVEHTVPSHRLHLKTIGVTQYAG